MILEVFGGGGRSKRHSKNSWKAGEKVDRRTFEKNNGSRGGGDFRVGDIVRGEDEEKKRWEREEKAGKGKNLGKNGHR